MLSKFSNFEYSKFSFFPVYKSEKRLCSIFRNVDCLYFKDNTDLFKKSFVDARLKGEYTKEITREEYENEPENNRILQIDYSILDNKEESEIKEKIYSQEEFDCRIFIEFFSNYYSELNNGDRELFLNEFLMEFIYDINQLKNLLNSNLKLSQKIYIEYFLKIYHNRWIELWETYKSLSKVINERSVEINKSFENLKSVFDNRFKINEKIEKTKFFILMEMIAIGTISFEKNKSFNYLGEEYNPTSLNKKLKEEGIDLPTSYLNDTLTNSQKSNNKNIFFDALQNKIRHNYIKTKHNILTELYLSESNVFEK